MHTALDPRLPHLGGEPALRQERYESELKAALEDLKKMSTKAKSATANGVGTGTSTPTGTTPSASAPQASASATTKQQASSPAPMAVATPPSLAQGITSNPNTPAGSPRPPGTGAMTPGSQAGVRPGMAIRPALPVPDGIMSLDELRRILSIADAAKRTAYLNDVCCSQIY
jgi:hypothetical protein